MNLINKSFSQFSQLQFNCTVDTSYRFTYYQISYSLIFICGLASNSRALWHLCLKARSLTGTAIYMANLAVVDLFFIVSLPLRIYYYYKKSHDSSWSPGSIFCQLTFSLKYISLYGGIFFLACIGLDRYIALVRPVARLPRRARNARSISTAIWLLVLALNLALPFLQSTAFSSQEHSQCLLDPSSGRHRIFILVALGLVQGSFLLPTALLLYSYCCVLCVLSKTPHRGKSHHRRALALIYCVLAVFLLCFAPYHTNLLLYTLTHVGLITSCNLVKVTTTLHPIMLSLASANCCLNPLVYYCSRRQGRKETNRGSL